MLLLIHRLVCLQSLAYRVANGNTRLKETCVETCKSLHFMWLVQVGDGVGIVRQCPFVPSSLLSTPHSALKASVPSTWTTTVGPLYSSRVQTMGRLCRLLTSLLQACLGFSTSLTSSLFFQQQLSLLIFILWTLVTVSLS